jgi:hypothetical protein
MNRKEKTENRRNGPYVLLGTVLRVQKEEQEDKFIAHIHKLPIGSMHGTESDLDRYIKKGFVVLDYWIPKADDIPAPQDREGLLISSGWALEMRSQEGGQRIKDMERILKGYMNQGDVQSAQLKAKDQEIDSLAAKLAEAEKKLALKEESSNPKAQQILEASKEVKDKK